MPGGIQFHNPSELITSEIISGLGNDLIIKPTDQGSSVSLFLVSGEDELTQTLSQLRPGSWLLEERVFGREVTIGILEEHPLGIVEVIPVGGVYDYKRKYTQGLPNIGFLLSLIQKPRLKSKSLP